MRGCTKALAITFLISFVLGIFLLADIWVGDVDEEQKFFKQHEDVFIDKKVQDMLKLLKASSNEERESIRKSFTNQKEREVYFLALQVLQNEEAKKTAETLKSKRLERIKEGKLKPPRVTHSAFSKRVHKEDFNAGWTLIRLERREGHKGADSLDDYKFIMCRVAWGAHAQEPENMPFFKDLLEASGCNHDENRMTFSYEDAEMYLKDRSVAPLVGFIHHEARVGSTLLANLLAANEEYMVYSESQPIQTAHKTCRKCPREDRIKLLQMTVKLNGISEFHKGIWYKLVPSQLLDLELFKAAFPDTPYIYLYREPVEVMMSQLKKQEKGRRNRINADGTVGGTVGGGKTGREGQLAKLGLMDNFNKAMSPPCLRRMSQVNAILGIEGSATASKEEYCAVSLKVICEAAANGMESDPMGLPVHYSEELAPRFLEFVLPQHFKVSLPPDVEQKALEISQHYSKSRKPRNGEYQDDASTKQARAWDDLKINAEKYAGEIYHRLRGMEESKSLQLQS